MRALSAHPVGTEHVGIPAASTGGRRVLFACGDDAWPASALLRAHVFAEQLRDELFALRVCSQQQPTWRIRRRKLPLASLQRIEVLEQSRAAMLSRCATVLWPSLPESQILTLEGDFVETVIRTAAEIGAELIVLPPQPRSCGDVALQIVHAARVPVLVARPGRSHNIVVAATNLRDGRYPVLRHARSISSLLQAELLLVHNVEATLPVPTLDAALLWLPGLSSAPADAQAQRLARVAAEIPRCTGTVVASEANTAQAILNASRTCDADLIVVGVARSYSRWERLLGKSVAARVADHAYRSVLMFPVSPPSTESVTLADA